MIFFSECTIQKIDTRLHKDARKQWEDGNGEENTQSGNQLELLRRRFVVTYTNASPTAALLPNTREYRCDATHLDEPRRHAAAPAAVNGFVFTIFTRTTRPGPPARESIANGISLNARRWKYSQLYHSRERRMQMRSAYERIWIGRTSVYLATIKRKYRLVHENTHVPTFKHGQYIMSFKINVLSV